MATKSILKTIHIKKRKSAISLVRALETASGKAEKEVTMSSPCSEATREEIQQIYSELR